MADLNPNQTDFRQFLHSFQSPLPVDQIQSFSSQGNAPYGLVVGAQPTLMVPSPPVPAGPQPVYHVKVTATPIQVPANLPDGPEYVVTAFPDMRRQRQGVITKEGHIIAHASPDLAAAYSRGVSIQPVHYDQVSSTEFDTRGKPSHSQPSSSSPKETDVLAAAGQELNYETDKATGHALVHVYAGEATQTTRQLLAQAGPGLTSRLTSTLKQSAETESYQGATLPVERGYSRCVPRPIDIDADADQKTRMYNWIIPTTKGAVELAEEKIEEEGDQAESSKVDLDRLFAQASAVLSETVRAPVDRPQAETAHDVQFVSSPTDDELGLPNQLRPSLIYGGVELAPPEFAGQKGALNYKLHAIEVHQYIALPDSQDPWIVKNQMNPATSAIFGPMPMPFDPAHSGMVAPTFQKTIHLQPTPALSPEMAKMFNHELTVVSNLLDTLPNVAPAAMASMASTTH